MKNIVALGAVQAAVGVLHEQAMLATIHSALQKKPALAAVNEEAFRRGMRAVRGP